MFSAQIFQENIFLKTKPNFSLNEKCFPLTNFSNGKQTQESLESGFPKKKKLTGKWFPLISNGSFFFMYIKNDISMLYVSYLNKYLKCKYDF